MDAALELLDRVVEHPVTDDAEPLVGLRSMAIEAGVRLAFGESPRRRVRPRLYFVRRTLAEPILAAASDFASNGYTLVIEDAFRTREMERELTASDRVLGQFAAMIRAADPTASPTRIVRRLSAVAPACPKTAGHMTGAAIDVSIADSHGRILDCGRPPSRTSQATPLKPPRVSRNATRNRHYVSATLGAHGFAAHPFEFGHYSLDDAFARVIQNDRRPASFAAVNLFPGGAVAPVEDQLASFDDPHELVARVARLLPASRRSGHAITDSRRNEGLRTRTQSRH
jgi:D-alanyl-D-alanine dipeptidase